jgi:hypothetical protein
LSFRITLSKLRPSISTGYGLNGRVAILVRVKGFSLLHTVHTCPEAHLTSYPMAAAGSFPGGKAARV